MTKQNNSESLRSMFFVPGFRKKFLDKSISFDADALILDVEDSVPDAYKDDARENIKMYLDNNKFNKKVFIRLNSLDSGYLNTDLKYFIHKNIYGFVPTMIKDEVDIVFYDKLLDQLENENELEQGYFKLCPLIETGSAVMKSYDIARTSKRIIGLAFGAEDFLTDMDGLHKTHGISILTARSMIVMAARSLGLEAIDTPYLKITDLDGFKKELNFCRELGFSGKLLIHPSQIDPSNSIFSPSQNEIDEARKIIAAIDESSRRGEGVTLIDGALVGPPMEKRARNVIKKYEKINK